MDQERSERSSNPMDGAYMSVANGNKEDGQRYEALHPDESTHDYINQSVSAEAEGVTEPVEDGEYEEIM